MLQTCMRALFITAAVALSSPVIAADDHKGHAHDGKKGEAHAHDSKPMFGGVVTEVKDISYELVAKADALTLHVTWEVFRRYALDSPRAWAFDVMIMFYGVLFMMAGAYTLAKNGHVRGDVLYGFFRPRTQAAIDLVLYIVFFLPGVIALTYAGYFYAEDSWRINEHSNITYEGPPIYPFKAVIPLAGAILLVQGIVELWPK